MLQCQLSSGASSPQPLNASAHLTKGGKRPEEELSFFPVPPQKPHCNAACPQPETGAARAPLPSQAEARQPIRLGLPHRCRVQDQPVPNPCHRSDAEASNEVGSCLCRQAVARGPCEVSTAAQRGPQVATNPDACLHRHVQAPFPGAALMPERGSLLCWQVGGCSPPSGRGREGPCPQSCPLPLPLPAESPARPAPRWALGKAQALARTQEE